MKGVRGRQRRRLRNPRKRTSARPLGPKTSRLTTAMTKASGAPTPRKEARTCSNPTRRVTHSHTDAPNSRPYRPGAATRPQDAAAHARLQPSARELVALRRGDDRARRRSAASRRSRLPCRRVRRPSMAHTPLHGAARGGVGAKRKRNTAACHCRRHHLSRLR